MMRITQTREMTKVRRNAMNASRARCRTGRGGALCFRVSFVLSSFQFMMTENSTADYADNTDGNKAKSVSGSRFLSAPSAKSAVFVSSFPNLKCLSDDFDRG